MTTLALFCSCTPEQQNIGYKDQTGNYVNFETTPQKVVCLQSSLASCWKLAGGSYIGIPGDYYTYGLDLGNAKIIGIDSKNPNLSMIMELNPDLIIYSHKISKQVEVANNLKKMNYKIYGCEIDSFSDYEYVMNHFTSILNRKDLYKTNVIEVKNKIDSIIAKCPKESKIKIAFVRAQSEKQTFIASNNIVTEMLKDLNTLNISNDITIQDVVQGTDVSKETVLLHNPKHIFVVFMGSKNIEKSKASLLELLNSGAFKDVEAIKNENIHYLPSDLFQYKPNNRWAEAYEYLYNILYGNEK